ncbi:unknown [Ruminococcus sp. CAG:579]|nr:unknown [Ruminococcus sp. CAG:579]
MEIIKSIYLVDTSETVLKSRIDSEDNYELVGDLFLNITDSSARFYSLDHDLTFENVSIGIGLSEDNKPINVTLVDENDMTWVFERL